MQPKDRFVQDDARYTLELAASGEGNLLENYLHQARENIMGMLSLLLDARGNSTTIGINAFIHYRGTTAACKLQDFPYSFDSYSSWILISEGEGE